MMKRAVRLGVFVLIGFVVGSLILGTTKDNPFVDNLVYGLWTGAVAGAAVAILYMGVSAVRHRQHL